MGEMDTNVTIGFMFLSFGMGSLFKLSSFISWTMIGLGTGVLIYQLIKAKIEGDL